MIKKLLILFVPILAWAEGPIYTLGNNETHTFSCTPPTERTNGYPVEVDELAHTTLYLIPGTPDGTPYSEMQSDIYCNTIFSIDSLSAGQWYMRATITDTGGRVSELSPSNGPFVLTVLPPNAPTVTN